ncbi:hypothetical protein FH972_019252 [Carpinus fangiana]|uniref:Uncharacterized protein n=1 Tax=Carpinus fangiana TaxID=176857 RepID=A0A5N6RPV0_9ROSI|nr:hypothetical protein FH972_019252 [Carpinus fangiana]
MATNGTPHHHRRRPPTDTAQNPATSSTECHPRSPPTTPTRSDREPPIGHHPLRPQEEEVANAMPPGPVVEAAEPETELQVPIVDEPLKNAQPLVPQSTPLRNDEVVVEDVKEDVDDDDEDGAQVWQRRGLTFGWIHHLLMQPLSTPISLPVTDIWGALGIKPKV